MIGRTAVLVGLGLGLRCQPQVAPGCGHRRVAVTRPPPPAITCPGGRGASNLDGVSIVFPPQPCTLSLATVHAGVALPYEIRVDHDLDQVVPQPAPRAPCTPPDPSGLIVRALISGHDAQGAAHHFCSCDTGHCAVAPQAIALHAGRYASVLDWDGTEWDGPGAAGSPHGRPFPPGVYTLIVIATGTRAGAPFEVSRAMTFSLVP